MAGADGQPTDEEIEQAASMEKRPMITNRGFIPSAIIVLFFGVSVHLVHRFSMHFPNAGPMLAIFLLALMFEWQQKRGRFTYGRIERRQPINLALLYQKEPFVRNDGTVISATPVEVALMKLTLNAAIHLDKTGSGSGQ